MATTTHATRLEAGRRVFTRIVVGIDGSQQALEAARQAALLQDVDGQLTLLSVWDIAPTIIGGTGTEIPHYFDEELQRTTAEQALLAARGYIAPYTAATGKLVRGTPVAKLLEEIERDEDTLVAIGSSGTGRLLGIVEGAVATEIIHKAPCSVLVARPVDNGFPRRVVVGVDGSVESAAAYAAARYIAERFGAELHALVAWGGKGVNERLVATITEGDHEDRREGPADALASAAESADLVIVGSRGLHGLRALGSISERVAHSAPCSTLVVREPVWQRVAEELGR
ncbi:MAG TPA: universal stress protein [Gaiellaceae bacterium]|nr:universal stress protein [Gaiellaceae bacterium]